MVHIIKNIVTLWTKIELRLEYKNIFLYLQFIYSKKLDMGPCPSNTGGLMYPFMDCANTWTWLDPNTVLAPLGGESDTITISGVSGGSFTSANFHTVFSDSI